MLAAISWSAATAPAAQPAAACLPPRLAGADGLVSAWAAFALSVEIRPACDQVLEVLLVGLAAELLPAVGHVLQHVGGSRPALADDVADGGRRHQDLDRRHPRLLVLLREQLLRDDGAQRLGEAHPADLALVARAGWRSPARPSRRRPGSGIVAMTRCPVSAALIAVSIVSASRISPSHHDVGILPQRRAEPDREAVGVDPHLALGDGAAQVAVQELDRVLEGDDVLVLGAG